MQGKTDLQQKIKIPDIGDVRIESGVQVLDLHRHIAT